MTAVPNSCRGDGTQRLASRPRQAGRRALLQLGLQLVSSIAVLQLVLIISTTGLATAVRGDTVTVTVADDDNQLQSRPEPWEAMHGDWRMRNTVPVDTWFSRFPKPVRRAATRAQPTNECLRDQVTAMQRRLFNYQSPDLKEVKAIVDKTLEERGLKLSVVVFWGRLQYVSILWPYLERNLRVNHGSIDELVLAVTDPAPTQQLLDNITSSYPDVVRTFRSSGYSMGYTEGMKTPNRVYVKVRS